MLLDVVTTKKDGRELKLGKKGGGRRTGLKVRQFARSSEDERDIKSIHKAKVIIPMQNPSANIANK